MQCKKISNFSMSASAPCIKHMSCDSLYWDSNSELNRIEDSDVSIFYYCQLIVFNISFAGDATAPSDVSGHRASRDVHFRLRCVARPRADQVHRRTQNLVSNRMHPRHDRMPVDLLGVQLLQLPAGQQLLRAANLRHRCLTRSRKVSHSWHLFFYNFRFS